MLRPERMSRASVTGSKRVMSDVIEAVHELDLVHVTDYDDSWDGFEPGDPIEGADDASTKLVTVRSLQNILGVEEDDADTTRLVTEEALDSELEEVRQEVNELDDRRDEVEDELRSVEERIEGVAPFADIGIDMDLLSGYDDLSVSVGEGDADRVRGALADADDVEAFEVYTAEESNALAVFVYPADASVEDVLVGTEFTAYEVPDAEGSPSEYEQELEREREQLESELESLEDEMADLRQDVAGFLLAAEEKLAIEVQKREAPLSFATTENAFVAEGWIPSEQYADLEAAIEAAVGDHAEIEELERADYEDHDEHHHAPTESPSDNEAVADGGTQMSGGEPPVIQDNPDPVSPFEALVEVINRPNYDELDPTVVLFLTFPAFYGFMIGDLGYGILYTAIGYWLYSSFDSDVVKSLGGVAMWAGGFTMLFGILYGEIFGLHSISTYFWEGVVGLHSAPMHKGLQPAEVAYAQAWLLVSFTVGILHVGLGYVFDFHANLAHGVKDAVLESASWILLMVGVWVFIFSRAVASMKPTFMFEVFSAPGTTLSFLAGSPEVSEHAVAYALGFTGFSASVGMGALVVAAVGLVLLIVGEGGIGLLESLNVVVNVLSYARIAAVLLAKAGMAFVVNLLFFGAYTHHGEFHFMLGTSPAHVIEEYGAEAIMFPGLSNAGIAGLVGGLVILVFGHALVLVLGVTSAGLQAVRLEYVEFFGKFYEGGGEKYQPFGYDRRYTSEE